MTQPLLNYHLRSKEEPWRGAVDWLFDLLKCRRLGRLDLSADAVCLFVFGSP